MEELVSIIVPVYNVSAYLENCINSLAMQTYSNIEIILVNDGSTDNSLEICRHWAQKDLRIKIIDKENGGVSSARNSGMLHATGEYFAFIDSDDKVEYDYISKLYKAIVDNDADVAFCGYKKNNKDCLIDNNCQYEIIEKKDIGKALLIERRIGIVPWGRLFKKSIIGTSVFPDGRINEDDLFSHEIFSKCNKIVKVNEPLYYYTVNNNGTTYGSFSKKAIDILYIAGKRLPIIKEAWKEYLPQAMYVAACSFIDMHIEYAKRKLKNDIDFKNKLMSDREALYKFFNENRYLLDEEIWYKVDFYYYHPESILRRDKIRFFRNDIYQLLRRAKSVFK